MPRTSLEDVGIVLVECVLKERVVEVLVVGVDDAGVDDAGVDDAGVDDAGVDNTGLFPCCCALLWNFLVIRVDLPITDIKDSSI
jgi:hypothetical protein